ncbi:MAG: hypothetical protein WBX25_29135 [Rhodomicrobium sp.]
MSEEPTATNTEDEPHEDFSAAIAAAIVEALPLSDEQLAEIASSENTSAEMRKAAAEEMRRRGCFDAAEASEH